MYWMILTGEYPPQTGGVSDYTRLVARGLAAAGDEVHVWAPPCAPGGDATDSGITVHRLPDHFGLRSFWRLSGALRRSPADARILVQYVPQAFGWDTMNYPFCAWLDGAGRRRALDVMFHEVAVDRESGWPSPKRLRRQLHALATEAMARRVVRSARRIFLSIPGWEPVLESLGVHRRIEWLPIPSTMPVQVDAARVANLRDQLLAGAAATKLVGHFGTFSGHIAAGLRSVIRPAVRAGKDAKFLLIGRGSREFAEALRRDEPETAAAIEAVGALEPAEVAEHLAACDLLVQPYIDGVSSRRTSAMAGLALGLPLLTTTGHLTEPIWAASGAVRLASSYKELAGQIGALLDDPVGRAQLGLAAAALYRERFQLERTLAMLRAADPALA